MFDENKYTESDNLIRSILSQAEEEVPAHVWEGISSELDRFDAAKKTRPVVLWFRRSAVAAAAAAAIVAGVFISRNESGDIVPEAVGRNVIAVAETSVVKMDTDLRRPAGLAAERNTYLADAEDDVKTAEDIVKEISEKKEETTAKKEEAPAKKEIHTPQDTWTDIWAEEDEPMKKRRRVALTISGIAGTNSAQSTGAPLFKRPSLSTSKPVTGVEQKSTESTYGLPVSFGAGVKFDLSGRWSLGVGANYTLLARKFFGTYTLVGEDGRIQESVSSDIRNMQQYVGIPVNAFYSIVDKEFMNFYAYAGGTVEKCISDKYEILNTTYIHRNNVSGVQVSANIGIGMEFLLGRHLGLYLDPSLRYYFDCGQPKSIRTAQPLMLGLEMGLRVRL
jgi:hypothetical protein